MRKTGLLATTAFATVIMTVTSFGQDAKQTPQVERGKYLAEQVSRCQDCHTPKTATGEFVKEQWFKGTTLNVTPSAPIADWHQKSPDITSTSALWQRWGQDGLVAFLQTAKNPRGGKAGPPMPAYTLTKDDAEAIVAFLKTLP
jgi:mono/diheme cytochrome c family protein